MRKLKLNNRSLFFCLFVLCLLYSMSFFLYPDFTEPVLSPVKGDCSYIPVYPFPNWIQNCSEGRDNIPNIVHFVWTTNRYKHKDFPFLYYISIMAARNILKPDLILFHFSILPQGYWWGFARRHVALHQVSLVVGSERHNHFYEVLLENLLSKGGIFLDLNVIILRPLTPLGHIFQTVVDESSLTNGKTVSKSLLKYWHVGGNSKISILMAHKQSLYLTKIYNILRKLKAEQKRFRLRRINSDNVTALSRNSFLKTVRANEFFKKNRNTDFTSTIAVKVINDGSEQEVDHRVFDRISCVDDIIRLKSVAGTIFRYILKLNNTVEILI